MLERAFPPAPMEAMFNFSFGDLKPSILRFGELPNPAAGTAPASREPKKKCRRLIWCAIAYEAERLLLIGKFSRIVHAVMDLLAAGSHTSGEKSFRQFAFTCQCQFVESLLPASRGHIWFGFEPLF